MWGRNIKSDAQKILKLQNIVKVTSESNSTQVPLTNDQISRIADVANRFNITLPLDVLNVLYDNKRNVSFINSYIRPRIITFLTAKKLLSSPNDKYFDIKLLNLCIRVKKETLTFEDDEVSQTKLFDDFESLKVACKLYVWNIKLNNCAKLNLLDETEIIAQYTKETGRLCRIANVPVKYEPPADDEQTEETDEDSSINPEDQEDEDSEQTGEETEQTGEQTEPTKQTGEQTGEQTDEQTGEQTEQTNSESFNNIEKFSDTLTDSDYQYIITTAVFIFILYLMYINYKN